MKRCVQCHNDLPDTALHCVYCGAKQPAAPAPVAGPGARTVMGYPGMASDLARQGGAPPAAPPRAARGAPNPASQPGAFDATLAAPADHYRERRDGGGFGSPSPAGGFAASAPRPAPDPYAPPGRNEPQPHGYGPPPGGPGFGPGPGPGPGPAASHRAGSAPAPYGFGPPPDAGFGHGQPPQQQHGFGPPPGDQGFAFGPGARPGSQPQPPPHPQAHPHGQPPPHPQHGFGPPQQQPPHHGYGPPPDAGYGAQQHLYGPPPAGSGFNPMHGPGHAPQHGPPHAPQQHGYGPPPAGFHARPETELVAPLRPPYPMSEAMRRGPAPMEPWSESLRTLMLVFGVLLIACFVAPWAVLPGKTTFSWSTLSNDQPISLRIVPLLFLATGVLSVLLGALPLRSLVRGFAAAGIGLAPIVYGALVPAFVWRELVSVIGTATLFAGLLVRSHYTGEVIGRVLATIGALCVFLTVLIPAGDSLPLIDLFKALGHGQAAAMLKLMPVVLALLALLVWLPAPSRAGAHILAWLIIVWPLPNAIALWLLGPDPGTMIKAALAAILYAPLGQMAWTALTGYGIASVVGKQLDHHF